MKKIAIVLGTRPEAIKLAPVIIEGRKRKNAEILVWNTGQHRDLVRPMLGAFSIEPSLDLCLMSPGQSSAELFSRVVSGISSAIEEEKPDWVLVQGDTTTAAAACLSAFYQNIPVGHVEAGLRTGDLFAPWPEEYHRKLISLSATWHFAPTEATKKNLLNEAVLLSKVLVTGNTGIDALLWMVEKLRGKEGEKFQEKWGKIDFNRPVILCTLHRREAFGEAMLGFMQALVDLSSSGSQVILPLHPNPEVRKAAQAVFGGKKLDNLFLEDPLDYQEFIWLMDRATLLLTDSGGVQEEAPTLGKPLIITRDKTERPEAVEAGAAILAGTDREKITNAVLRVLNDETLRLNMGKPRPIFGDGKASQRIFDTLFAL